LEVEQWQALQREDGGVMAITTSQTLTADVDALKKLKPAWGAWL